MSDLSSSKINELRAVVATDTAVATVPKKMTRNDLNEDFVNFIFILFIY